MGATTADDLLPVFAAAADAHRSALEPLTGEQRRARTDRPGQYALDLVVDAAVLPVLHAAGVAVVSEESGWSGDRSSPVTVVVDPVDGSTNCSREIPYWGISLCALDADGPLCALVTNTPLGERITAVRGAGAHRNGTPLIPSTVTQVEDAVVAISGMPKRVLGWKQFRAMGSAALSLCDVASGRLDAMLDALPDRHGPWDYLGGLLVCTEAGATVRVLHHRSLTVADPDARRQLIAGATAALVEDLVPAIADEEHRP
jgi:fructose-1,6-bisphosphatase/inositol monophosphatase family enzyme